MHEKLLQFIWRFQYFNSKNLTTTSGEKLLIIHVGELNKNQGPDFLDGRIKIANAIFAGNIELHVKTSDWILHKHSNDKRYSNIILHVVWQHDKEIPNTYFPTVELQPLVATSMLRTYETLMDGDSFIPCETFLPALNHLQWTVWKDRLLAERLERKSNEIKNILNINKNDWSETCWQMLARNFGAKINADIFFDMAKSLSVKLLANNKHHLSTIEALLFGQCELLNNECKNAYAKTLQKEYQFFQKKYQLQPILQQPKFLRMRPQNFPTIRLAQLASLVYHSDHLFSKIISADNYTELKKMFEIETSAYWDEHYTLEDNPHENIPKHIGISMIDIILINTIIPMLFAYGEINLFEAHKEKAIRFLSEIKSEDNSIIRSWRNASVASHSAFDSQALLELKNNYFNNKMCLNCTVGNYILKR